MHSELRCCHELDRRHQFVLADTYLSILAMTMSRDAGVGVSGSRTWLLQAAAVCSGASTMSASRKLPARTKDFLLETRPRGIACLHACNQISPYLSNQTIASLSHAPLRNLTAFASLGAVILITHRATIARGVRLASSSGLRFAPAAFPRTRTWITLFQVSFFSPHCPLLGPFRVTYSRESFFSV